MYRLRDLYSGIFREPRQWSDEVIKKVSKERRSVLELVDLPTVVPGETQCLEDWRHSKNRNKIN